MYKGFIFFVLLLAACKGPSSVPGNVLGYNEMKTVLWDMAQADEFVTVYIHGTAQKVKDENLLLYQKIFALHEISSDEFAKSFAFYKSHPVQEKILMDSLSQFAARLRQERPVPFTPPPRLNKLINPAPMRMGGMQDGWHQYQILTNFWYDQNSL